MVELMALMDASALCRLAHVSRALYIFSHADDIWKALFMEARFMITL